MGLGLGSEMGGTAEWREGMERHWREKEREKRLGKSCLSWTSSCNKEKEGVREKQ